MTSAQHLVQQILCWKTRCDQKHALPGSPLRRFNTFCAGEQAVITNTLCPEAHYAYSILVDFLLRICAASLQAVWPAYRADAASEEGDAAVGVGGRGRPVCGFCGCPRGCTVRLPGHRAVHHRHIHPCLLPHVPVLEHPADATPSPWPAKHK